MHRLTGLASSLGFFSIFPDQTQKVERSKNVLNTSIQKNDADGSCAEEEEEEKLEFLEKYGSQYGYPESTTPIHELRSKEFARLAGTVYVDHAGATLHSDSQLRGALDDLSANLYSNPRIQPFLSFFLSFPHLIVHCLRGLKQPKSCELGNQKGGYGR
jgi:hypothetical protein